MRARECVPFSLRPGTCTSIHPPTHPHQHRHDGSRRSRPRDPAKRGNHPTPGRREVSAVRVDTHAPLYSRGRGLPGAISRGRRRRRPKTLIARVVDTRRVFRRTSSVLGSTYPPVSLSLSLSLSSSPSLSLSLSLSLLLSVSLFLARPSKSRDSGQSDPSQPPALRCSSVISERRLSDWPRAAYAPRALATASSPTP